MQYVVISYVTDPEDANKFNSVHCGLFKSKEEAKKFVKKVAERRVEDYKNWLDNKKIEHSEEVATIVEEETKVRIRCDVKMLRKEDQCLNARYEILELR